MSDTPRTDAATMFPGDGIAMVRPEFARELERECSALRELLEESRAVISNFEELHGCASCDPESRALVARIDSVLTVLHGQEKP